MKYVAGLLIAALAITDAWAQTYQCKSTVTPGAIYLSYGKPCPPGSEYKALPEPKARTQAILKADARGQYFVTAYINGVPAASVIDTGATNVSMNMEEARRMGVDFTNARRGTSQTANGAVPVYLVTLASVQVGDMVLYNVSGNVSDGGASQNRVVLIGMSFLRHFEIQHVADTLTLTRP
jgi:aspartyl protease family protein